MGVNNLIRSRQLNPCDELYWKSRGYPGRPDNWREILQDPRYLKDYYDDEYYDSEEGSYDDEDYDSEEEEDEDAEEHRIISNRNNPNNIEYWLKRRWSYRPDNWREIVFGYRAA